MTPRERMLCALGGGTPDRVPYCEVGVSAQVIEGLGGSTAQGGGGIDAMDGREIEAEVAVSELLGRDVVCYRAQPMVPAERLVGADGIAFYGDGPVKSLADLDRIALPDPEGDAIWGDAKAFLAGAGDYATCLVTRVGISAAYLACGMETFAIAMYEDPDLVAAVLDRYSAWSARVVCRAGELGFDFVWTADDIAYKTGPLFSPAMFRQRVLPFVRRVADAVSTPWVFHSDGDLTAVLDDLVDLGISAFNPIEPEAMDIVAVKQRWGDRICLIGNVSVHTLAAGTEDEVRGTVERLLRDVAPGGGYVLSSGNSLASYCRPENVKVMLDTLREHGAYAVGA